MLLLGPLYYLIGRDDRMCAWREAGRVVRPDGVVVGAVITRFASLFAGVVTGEMADAEFLRVIRGALRDGWHRNVGNARRWFTVVLPPPGTGRCGSRGGGFAGVRALAVEGPVWMTVRRLDEILGDAAQTELLLKLLRAVEDEDSLFGTSGDLLTVGRRAPGSPHESVSEYVYQPYRR